jgi:hypothetical protein
MSRWFRLYDEMLDDPKVQMLPPELFKTEFMKAIDGQLTVFAEHVRSYTGRPSATEWAVTRKRIFSRDQYTCAYCGAHGVRLQCDHIIPVARGGSNGDDNLTTSCEPCNRAKRSKLVSVEEWSKLRRVAQ